MASQVGRYAGVATISAPARPRFSVGLFASLVALPAAIPIWAFVWPASCDWSRHVVGVDFLLRVLTGDGDIAACYRLNLQPVGYHLFYLLAVPLAAATGAFLAVKIVMTATLVAHVAVCAAAARREGATLLFGLVGVPMFYGSHFAWGFVVSLLATPMACWVLTLLADAKATEGGRPRAWLAGLVTVLAGTTHAIFAPLCGLAAAMAWLLRRPGGRRLPAAVLGGAVVTTLPGAWLRLERARTGTEGSQRYHVTFSEGLQMLAEAARGIDNSLAAAGLLLALATLCLAALVPAKRPLHGQARRGAERFLLLLLPIYIALVWLVPYKTRGAIGASYLLNVRALPLAMFCGLLIAVRRGGNRRGLVAPPLILAAVLTLMGVWRLHMGFAARTADWQRAIATFVPRSARLAAISQDGWIDGAAPPVLLGMPAMAAVRHLRRTNFLFLNEQLPLSEQPACQGDDLGGKAGAFVDMLQGDASQAAIARDLWTVADFAFAYRSALAEAREPYLEEGVVLARGREWVLLAPPSACFVAGDGQ